MKNDNLKNEYTDPWDQGTYQTGSTNPPKNHSGLVAFLLIAVIFLAGITSLLGIMNIRLFSALMDQQESTVSMSLHADTKTAQAPSVSGTRPNDPSEHIVPEPDQSPVFMRPGMGFTGEPVSGLYQYYYRLPEGMFITEVTAGSNAAHQGLASGDILVSLDGTTVTTDEELASFLYSYEVGDTINAVIYRSKKYHTITLTVEEAKG